MTVESPVDPASAAASRAATIVSSLDRATKIKLLSGADVWHTEALPEHDLPGVLMTDGPHGVRLQDSSPEALGFMDAYPATCFPTGSALAATWDPTMLHKVGEALGKEARGLDVHVLLGPGLNIKRHPAGGRNFEYFSEDPLLSGKMAAGLVRGIQAQGVGACLKHYAVNNQETMRQRIDAIVDERTLREIYLTGFEIAVKESDPWTIMCAYNLINGVHAAESRELLTTILREQWGFRGLVMTDWGAVADRPAGVHAGLDLEMPGSTGAWDSRVAAAIDGGSLSEADLDTAAARVVTLIIRAAEASAAANSELDEPDAVHHLARRMAAEGAVLLTNDGILPLNPDKPSRVAVIGEFAEVPRFQGAGSSLMNPTKVEALLPTLRERIGATRVTYAKGYDAATGSSSDEFIEQAVAVAADADVVILMVGLPSVYESEGFDRESLRLPDDHEKLLHAVCDANERVVVVLSNGAPVEMPWSARPAAILEAYLGGQASGAALTDVLVGDAEPGGRLAESFPVAGRQLASSANWPGNSTQVQYREGLHVGYRFHDTWGIPALFPFGHGLSYTSWEYSRASILGTDTDVVVSLDVANVGRRAGSTVVQVYIAPPESSAVPRVAQELKAFAKVRLSAHDKTRVTVELDRRSFAVWDTAAKDWLVEAGTYLIRIGSSSTDIHAELVHTIKSGDELAASQATAEPVASDSEFTALIGRPVPDATPVLPFRYDSVLEELKLTWFGRQVHSRIMRAAAAEMPITEGDTSDATEMFMREMMRYMPLRGVSMMSGGALPLNRLDLLLKALNLTAGPKAWRKG